MKKSYLFPMTLSFLMLLSGCDKRMTENDVRASIAPYESQIAEMNSEMFDIRARNGDLRQELKEKDEIIESLENVSEAYDAYKEEMSPYQGLADAEAEARRIEAESIAEKEKKEKEESLAAEKAAAEAKEKLGYDTGITYDQLARNPENYKGEKIKFTGKVLQVMESDYKVEIRLATSKGYNDVIYCTYSPNIVSSRVLEDDRITVYGTSSGTITYQSTLGGKITIPGMHVDKIEQN